jgi:hypothetical protein
MLVLPVTVIPNDVGLLSPADAADRRHAARQRDGAGQAHYQGAINERVVTIDRG